MGRDIGLSQGDAVTGRGCRSFPCPLQNGPRTGGDARNKRLPVAFGGIVVPRRFASCAIINRRRQPAASDHKGREHGNQSHNRNAQR